MMQGRKDDARVGLMMQGEDGWCKGRKEDEREGEMMKGRKDDEREKG